MYHPLCGPGGEAALCVSVGLRCHWKSIWLGCWLHERCRGLVLRTVPGKFSGHHIPKIKCFNVDVLKFKGAIQGPGEFAEGLVLGVRSLFGHTVGGAAGAVSK
jgi:hypothetical protein